LMRQAGRYMAEYRALRETCSFLDMVETPELAAEVTLQPITAFDLDAAIIFSDILPLLKALGLDLEYVKGDGPVIHNPIRHNNDFPALLSGNAIDVIEPTLAAIRIVRAELNNRIPLIGFAGAPFTLASYAIEGKGSRDFLHTRDLMMTQPRVWHRLMEQLSTLVGDSLIAQANAGAQAVQLFDSWVGNLSLKEYQNNVYPYSKSIIENVKANTDVPFIHFGTKTTHLYEAMRELPCDVIGVDETIDLTDAWDIIGDDKAVQGNFDQALLRDGPIDAIEKHAAEILDGVARRPGHIFNLGHGIHKETPVDHVKALVDYVHTYSSTG